MIATYIVSKLNLLMQSDTLIYSRYPHVLVISPFIKDINALTKMQFSINQKIVLGLWN